MACIAQRHDVVEFLITLERARRRLVPHGRPARACLPRGTDPMISGTKHIGVDGKKMQKAEAQEAQVTSGPKS